MLTALRGSTGGIITKAFLVLLAGSFAVWGIADVFTGSRDQVLAKVGEREIGAREFRNFFDQRLQYIGRTTGRGVTTAQARQIGLDRQILGDLLRAGALDEQAKALRMSVSIDYIKKTVADSPAFKNADGNFDPNLLRRALYAQQVNEQQFIINERNTLLRGVVTGAINDGTIVPNTLLKLVMQQETERRDARYFTITGADIKLDDPDEKTLKAFFDSNKHRFAVPARRVLEVMYADAATLGKGADISEDLIKRFYDERRDTFGTLETRTIEQIPFSNEAEATEAVDKIKGGKSFEDIAKEKKLTDKDRVLGTFAKKDVPDAKIAAVAFKLKDGEVSAPVSGRLSTFLVRVTKITPEKVKTLAEVRDFIIKELEKRKGRDVIVDLRDKVEDERGAGTSFEEIAKAQKLAYVVTKPIGRAGKDKDGKSAAGSIPDWTRVLQLGFSTDVGLEVDPIATKNDALIWVNVREVIASHTKPFKDAKEDAIKLWKADQVRKELTKRAKALKEKLDGGAKFDELAKEQNAEIKTKLGVGRRTASADFGGAALQALYSVKPGAYAVALTPDGKGARIITSTPVLAPPFNPESKQAKQMAQQLAQLTSNDLFADYMRALQESVGVEIRPEGWRAVFQTNTHP